MKRFYSNGKLFITGEYVVLDGANAFALPTKTGQDLVVEAGDNLEIVWRSFDADGSIWFEATIPFSQIATNTTSDLPVKKTLVAILHHAHCMNPELLAQSRGFAITTRLTFPRKWGLGTSSTLINNIANWFEVDPFELLKNSFGGSGYDIACARNVSPIVYNINNGKPTTKKVIFQPEFRSKLYFIYLNQKQDSKRAIASYREKAFDGISLVKQINQLTEIALHTSDFQEFKDALEEHESIMGVILKQIPVKERLFPDFDGTVKSLGAWGGDFVLVASEEDPTRYFTEKGYPTVIKYKDMIL